MADYLISIDDTVPDVKMKAREDTISIRFNKAAIVWVSDPFEFEPTLWPQFHRKGKKITFTAGPVPETVRYHFLTWPFGLDSVSSEDQPVLGGGHTIQVSSGISLEGVLTSDAGLNKVLCECWPFASRLIGAILTAKSFPIPKSARAFLEALVKAGEAAYKLCPK
jgi:hypothetical protein